MAGPLPVKQAPAGTFGAGLPQERSKLAPVQPVKPIPSNAWAASLPRESTKLAPANQPAGQPTPEVAAPGFDWSGLWGKLKAWGPALGVGALGAGLYGLLSKKDEGESRLGRVARMGLMGAGAGALGYAGYKYIPQMYQQGRALMAKTSSVHWDKLDDASKAYLTGLVKACEVKGVPPNTLIPDDLAKAAMAGQL